MPFAIKECSIAELSRHRTLTNRTNGKVRVMLHETNSNEVWEHDLVIPVWTNTTEEMTIAEIRSALMSRAMSIVDKTISAAGGEKA